MLNIPSLNKLKQKLPRKFLFVLAINTVLILFQIYYIGQRIPFVNNEIPFWYTQPWGDMQLASKILLWALPAVTFGITTIGMGLSFYAKTKFMRYGGEMLLILTVLYNVIVTYSLVRIIKIASIPFPPLINPYLIDLAIPFIISLVLAYSLTPKLVAYATEKGIVTIPSQHKHPAMILSEPSARGGGLIVAGVFVLLVIFFIPLTKEVWGLIIAILILTVTGIADDIQNTNPFSKIKFMESPTLRLVLQAIAALIILMAGISITFINNPFDGILYFDQITFNLGGAQIAPLALFVTFVWIIWIINMLSWSNGIDGQYSGIVAITAIVIAVLALRNLEAEPGQLYVSKMAVILAGASLGLLPFTWHPSRVMWGFTATTAGLIIAVLSLMTQTKVSVSILALMVPMLDALITVTRRLLQGRSPLKGDRGHLHHLLLERGWTVKKIAIFYWVSAGLLGAIAIFSSEKASLAILLTLAGVITFPIILLNIANLKAKN